MWGSQSLDRTRAEGNVATVANNFYFWWSLNPFIAQGCEKYSLYGDDLRWGILPYFLRTRIYLKFTFLVSFSLLIFSCCISPLSSDLKEFYGALLSSWIFHVWVICQLILYIYINKNLNRIVYFFRSSLFHKFCFFSCQRGNKRKK